ncbi:hypothetical protein SAMD00019534_101270 [Acytostelium subglobosum LB1]|uniref:hypothetical protein n=1 Tax=Acytostelium subglobosum LB1 TaxID=1410327 RepID=UPI0006449F84|nr:hypothetical protein SAMD00019534_101270 [Acytostelium subglobosum LB1]GAM26952.1 hypothetical protein SAMD00019534_101270 [Acytostelium subglobosum LB1]|eukprot:XP_012750220.1 hypothetical protein SAMD00019534_101270 [Acytostelium subglobosum LB1]
MLSVIDSFLREYKDEQQSDLTELFIKSVTSLNDQTTTSSLSSEDISLKNDYILPNISELLAIRQHDDQEVLFWIGKVVTLLESTNEETSLERTMTLLSQAIAQPHWCYHILVDRQYLTTLIKAHQQTEAMNRLYTLYIDLLRLYNDCPDCYENISMAFGEERVSQELYQCMMSSTSSPTLRYGWLNDVTRSSALSRFLSTHKQHVLESLDTLQSSFVIAMRELKDSFKIVIMIVKEDEAIRDMPANQKRMINMISHSMFKDIADDGFVMFSPFINSDALNQGANFFQLFQSLKDVHNMNAIIKLIGNCESESSTSSFLKQYASVENIITRVLNELTWSDDYTTLVLLDGITQSFSSINMDSAQASATLQPLADHLEKLNLKSNRMAVSLPTIHAPVIIRSLVRLMEICGAANKNNTNLYRLAMIFLVQLDDEVDQELHLSETLIQKYPLLTKVFIKDQYRPMIYDSLSCNVHFLATHHRHNLLESDQKQLKTWGKRLLCMLLSFKYTPKVHRFVNSYDNVSEIWSQFIRSLFKTVDGDDNGDAYPVEWLITVIPNVLMLNGAADEIHPAAVFTFFKLIHSSRLSPIEHDWKSLKHTLLAKVNPAHKDYQSQRQSYIDHKIQSIFDRSPALNLDPSLWSSLPPIPVRHIIDHLVLDEGATDIDLCTHSRWVVSLSTVSKQFHQVVRASVSHNPVPSLGICDQMNHIGSTYCLFKSPPLHMDAKDLRYIPIKLINECLNNLESLVVPTDDGFLGKNGFLYGYEVGGDDLFDDDFGITSPMEVSSSVLIITIDAPRLRHIKFVNHPRLYDSNLLDNIREAVPSCFKIIDVSIWSTRINIICWH